jgi:hypothetical protein
MKDSTTAIIATDAKKIQNHECGTNHGIDKVNNHKLHDCLDPETYLDE